MQQNFTYNNTLLIQDIFGRKKNVDDFINIIYTLQLKMFKQF